VPVEEEDYQQGDLFQQTQQVGAYHVFLTLLTHVAARVVLSPI
jgi:hypothetical protein